MPKWWTPAPRQPSETSLSHAAARQASVTAIVSSRARSITEVVSKIENWGARQIQPAPLPNRAHRLLHWLGHRAEWMVALLATLLSIGAYIWYAAHAEILAYNDAVSYEVVARRVVSGRTPGLGQLGSVWLPLHQILMLPLIWFDPFYRSGFAGALPSMAAYVIAVLFLYRLASSSFTSRLAGWTGALLFALNPNVLYMQSTPMTEMELLCTIIVALFYLMRWAAGFRPLDLVWAAAAICAGSLVRYDAWAIGAIAAVLIPFIAWRKRGRDIAEASFILFSVLAFVGVGLWLLYNLLLFNDPLYFYRGPYSAQAQQLQIAQVTPMPAHNNLPFSAQLYTTAVADTVGWPLLIVAATGFVWWVVRVRLELRQLPLLLAVVPFAFNIEALYRGITIIQTPEFAPSGYFNERYGMMLLPAVALFVAYLASRGRTSTPIIALCVVAVIAVNTSAPYVLGDPTISWGGHSRSGNAQVASYLHAHYHGGKVLIGYGRNAVTLFLANLPDSAFVTDANGTQFNTAIADPQQNVQWIVLDVSAHGYNPDPIEVGLSKNSSWEQYFVLRDVVGTTCIYERVGSDSMKPRTGASERTPESLSVTTLALPAISVDTAGSLRALSTAEIQAIDHVRAPASDTDSARWAVWGALCTGVLTTLTTAQKCGPLVAGVFGALLRAFHKGGSPSRRAVPNGRAAVRPCGRGRDEVWHITLTFSTWPRLSSEA